VHFSFYYKPYLGLIVKISCQISKMFLDTSVNRKNRTHKARNILAGSYDFETVEIEVNAKSN
jgi:hypothetical protein